MGRESILLSNFVVFHDPPPHRGETILERGTFFAFKADKRVGKYAVLVCERIYCFRLFLKVRIRGNICFRNADIKG